ncbi:MAG TPA: PTS sugar transporter subunit IIA [Thermoanaerobacterales bacterium]|uniref:PTS sugar transporter subunit IIA n=1 Tax=Tepidanaerobacter sp. GT38 TaxID=2722793 RepID=UPI0017F07C45|nr:PTS sugar transporter subunit IIA [Tepidanaerobacter sp. GT38]MCG1012198.1 PTS sugar transporter subunit IIA [Tepidanaerobacter sp. GT38]HHY42956.1 PTS sugar transporter subunit IIA [Thermoanaerobacterales bacterium]
MIGIIIVTHGNFGSELLKSTELIIGKQKGIMAFGLFPGDSVDKLKCDIVKAVEQLDEGDGILVFVDIFNGSAASTAIISSRDLKGETKIEYIAGINMPMLLEALMVRESCDLSSLKNLCLEKGISGIKDLRKWFF